MRDPVLIHEVERHLMSALGLDMLTHICESKIHAHACTQSDHTEQEVKIGSIHRAGSEICQQEQPLELGTALDHPDCAEGTH